MATDTATLKDYTLRLFAHRTISNATVIDNPEDAVISYVRFFDSTGDYIQLPVCRNFCPDQAGGTARTNIFDDTGGNEADPEYASVTQYYHDLTLAAFVPRFNKTYDVSANSWGYSASPFTVADYKLYNAGGNVVAEATDTTVGFTITKGTRYLLRFKIRVFNDMVEQSIGENTRCILTKDGLKTILRRILHDNSPQDFGRPPMFVGVGGEGAYYIDNASDGRWRYDASATSYTVTTTTLFPSPSAVGDAFAFCREETDSDQLEGIEFDINIPGVLSTGASLLWQYWDGSAWTNLTGVVDNTVDLDPDSASYGSSLAVDGNVRWLAPPDIDVDAELKAGTVGCYYRGALVGGDFSTNPTVIGKAYPLVYRTVQTETSMQQPFTRKTADIIAAPYKGNAAKVSAEFGIGSTPERYDSNGLLQAKAFVPTRETAIFTTDALVSEEDISIVEVDGVTVTSGRVNIPTTNAEPLKLLTVMDSGGGATDGELMPIAGYVLTDDERAVTGPNYVVTLKGVPDGTYDIKYLAKTITPSITPLNIISVTGNTQSLLGPQQVFMYSSEHNPADTDGGGDTKLNPKLIMRKGFPVGGDTGPPLLPNMDSQFDEGLLSSPTKFGFGNVTKADKKITLGGTLSLSGLKGETLQTLEHIKITAGYPLIMLRFNVSDYNDLDNPHLMISVDNSTVDGGTVGAFVWTTGDVGSQRAHDKETAWRNVGYTKSRSGDVNVTQNMALVLDLKFVENGDGTRTSPVIDDNGNMFIMLAPSNKEYKDGRIKVYGGEGYSYLDEAGIKSAINNLRDNGIARLGTLGLRYASIGFSPVKNLRDEIYNFRRGIDWRYVLGAATADWVKQSSDPNQFAVTTLDGTTYYPVLPSMLFWTDVDNYFFSGNKPSDTNTDINLYVRDMPVDTAGVYVWLEGQNKAVDTLNGGITVNSVSWNDVGKWNNIDSEYADDHIESTTGGEGAGVINIDVDEDYWHGDEIRKVGVRYLAQTYPTLTTTYLVDRGLMFARAHFSPLSFNPSVIPDYGDSLRVYFEVQFEHKRT